MLDIHTWFALTCYSEKHHLEKHPYPSYMIVEDLFGYFDSAEDAESLLRLSPNQDNGVYCYSIRELPMDFQCYEGESLSERIYLSDGQLWSIRNHADLIPDTIPPEYSESDFDRALSRRLLFEGRSPEEIRFKKGDIIEVFTPMVGGASSAELAIVVDTPPTKEDIKERMVLYRNKKPPRHLLDRGFLGARFGSYDDFYTVISDHLPTNANPFPYYCPTHYAMRPRFKVPPEIRTQLQKMLERI